MPITIFAVGKKHEDWVMSGIERYQKRLKAPFTIEWVLLPHSSFEGDRARQEESERLSKRTKSYDYTILLDERGKNSDSPSLSRLLSTQFATGKRIALVIGGAYGVTDEFRQQADFVWSLSALVLPHQLVRLIVAEQMYRAQEIANGGKYHHS